MNNIIYLNSIQNSHQSALIFAIFDSLKKGEGITIYTDEKLDKMKWAFIESDISNFKWQEKILNDQSWQIYIQKTEEKLDKVSVLAKNYLIN